MAHFDRTPEERPDGVEARSCSEGLAHEDRLRQKGPQSSPSLLSYWLMCGCNTFAPSPYAPHPHPLAPRCS